MPLRRVSVRVCVPAIGRRWVDVGGHIPHSLRGFPAAAGKPRRRVDTPDHGSEGALIHTHLSTATSLPLVGFLLASNLQHVDRLGEVA